MMGKGLSPELKKCPLDTFLPALRGGPLSSSPIIHLIPQKISTPDGVLIFYGVDNGTRTHDLQSHNLTP